MRLAPCLELASSWATFPTTRQHVCITWDPLAHKGCTSNVLLSANPGYHRKYRPHGLRACCVGADHALPHHCCHTSHRRNKQLNALVFAPTPNRVCFRSFMACGASFSLERCLDSWAPLAVAKHPSYQCSEAANLSP